MVEFRIFASNSSNDENSDWKIVSDDLEGNELDLDFVAYEEFSFLDQD